MRSDLQSKRPSQPSASPEPVVGRWEFLEAEADACAVVSRKMEVLFLNEPARPLVPAEWLGRRCWEIFPVGEASCAARCPAVQAVNAAGEGGEILYCEESLYPGGQVLELGVAVIPLSFVGPAGERAVIVMRPKAATSDPAAFREECLSQAKALRVRVEEAGDGIR